MIIMKIKKALSFIITVIFLCQGVAYGAPERGSALRLPLGTGDDTLERFNEAGKLLNEAPGDDIAGRIEAEIRKTLLERMIKNGDGIEDKEKIPLSRLVEVVIQARRNVISGETSTQNYRHDLEYFCGIPYNATVKDEATDILSVDMSILNEMTRFGEDYVNAALSYAAKKLSVLERRQRVRLKKKISLSELSRRGRYVHSLYILAYAEKVKDIVAHVRNSGRITEEFLQSITDKEDGKRIIFIETGKTEGDKELYILQGNHRLAAMITLYNLGVIGDIEIDIFYSKGNNQAMEILSYVDKLYSIIGRGNKDIDFNRLKMIALEIIAETGSNLSLTKDVSLRLINAGI